MTLPGWIRHRRLSLKVVVAILLASSLVTLVVTSIQLYVEYRRDLNTLEQTLTDARGSFAGPLGASLWALDEDQLRLQLQGLQSLPHLELAELSGDAELSVGAADAALARAKRDPMTPVRMADRRQQSDTRRRLTLDADLHRALAESELLLH